MVIVVAGSLRDREAALDSLRALLKIGGPIALLLAAAAAGYLVAGAALRPVEAMPAPGGGDHRFRARTSAADTRRWR